MISPTRIRDLVGYAAAVTLITWLALRQWYGDLPRLSWFVPLSLLLLAIAETLAANQLRDRIRRRPGALPVQPLVAARMLALAKASAVVGAVMLALNSLSRIARHAGGTVNAGPMDNIDRQDMTGKEAH